MCIETCLGDMAIWGVYLVGSLRIGAGELDSLMGHDTAQINCKGCGGPIHGALQCVDPHAGDANKCIHHECGLMCDV